MVDGSDFAPRHRLGTQRLTYGAVFAVHDGQAANVRDGFHHTVELRVIQPEALVGQVEFETGDTGRHGLRQYVQCLRVSGVPCGDGHMQSIVHRHAAIGLGLTLLQRLQQRLLRLRLDEVNHRRRAAHRRRDGAAGEIVAADVVPYRHLQVDVRVHPAGENVTARGVEFDRLVGER